MVVKMKKRMILFGLTFLCTMLLGTVGLTIYNEKLKKQETSQLVQENYEEKQEEPPIEVPREAEKEDENKPADDMEEEEESEEILADNTYRKEAKSENEVILAFGGDICFHDEYANMYAYRQRGSDISKCITGGLLDEMRNADIFMVNNEFTYTNRGEPLPEKAFTFRSKPENVNILTDMGVDIVSLANNHSYDFGVASLLDSMDTLKRVDIPYAGAGNNIEEAAEPVYFLVNDMKIAYVCATQIERLSSPDTKGATENSPGVFRCFSEEELSVLLKTIETAKENSDFVVAYIHWGTENTDELDWAQTYQAPKLVDAGADLIIGGHPHSLQGLDSVKGVPVIYSIGNFWFNSKDYDTCLLKVKVNKQGIQSYQFLPAKQSNCTTYLAEGEEKTRIINYMREISEHVTIDEEGFVVF